MAQLQLIKQCAGILIPATAETRDFLHSKCKLGAVLAADFKQVRNPAFHRKFFALLKPLRNDYVSVGDTTAEPDPVKAKGDVIRTVRMWDMSFFGEEPDYKILTSDRN